MKFLERLAEQILREHGANVHRLQVLFPTRRAGLHFRHHLQRLANAPFWPPRIQAMGDWIVDLSGLAVPDPLELIFELYDVYSGLAQRFPKRFEEFYAWGKMLLADFDEIDKQLLDEETLFRALREFKEIEKLNIEEKSDIYRKYTSFWGELEAIYQKFGAALRSKNQAYEGLAYRLAAERVTAGQALDSERVLFCGFNAFNAAEEKIVAELLRRGQAALFWDMDEYFVNDANQEAGHFFRNQRQRLAGSGTNWIGSGLSEKKEIHITGVSSTAGLAKALGLELRRLLPDAPAPEEVVVVLPDETLLFPVLNSLPAEAAQVNITLGYPLDHTPLFTLLNALIEMQLHAGESEGHTVFYYRDLVRVLCHPYVRPLAPQAAADLLHRVRDEGRMTVPAAAISQPPLDFLFQRWRTSAEAIPFLQELFDRLRSLEESPTPLFALDLEYLYHFYRLLTRLKNLTKRRNLNMELRLFWQLFNDIARHERIPFSGEPLQGLQVMGMLETQALDFDQVCILSLNEGVLPAGKSDLSFIPPDVRTAVGLPTFRERDAISAYHFWRLLQRARRVRLFYVSQRQGLGIKKNEKSRFIEQLLIEYKEKNPAASVEQQILDFAFTRQQPRPIRIPKEETTLASLAERGISASALLTFRTCPLRFYLNYVEDIREEEEPADSPDQRRLGTILHEALRRLYAPLLGKTVGGNDWPLLRQRLDGCLRQAYGQEFPGAVLETGRNRIVWEVLQRLLKSFLNKEQAGESFQLELLEGGIESVPFEFVAGSRTYRVGLRGFIDRLDRQAGGRRIIDYKSGRVHPLQIEALADLAGAEVIERREVFQLLFYWYLLQRSRPDLGPCRLAVYPFKRLGETLRFVSVAGREWFGAELIGAYEETLRSLLSEIFSLGIPFQQTEDPERCRTCPYIDICMR